jgi:hypothetical protein
VKTTTTTIREFDRDGKCIKETTVVVTEGDTLERDDRVGHLRRAALIAGPR